MAELHWISLLLASIEATGASEAEENRIHSEGNTGNKGKVKETQLD